MTTHQTWVGPRRCVASLALVVAAVALSPATRAQDFNIDFSSDLVAPPASFGAAGSPGVWNSINPPGFPVSSAVPLVDSDGQATGVTVKNLSQSSFLGTYDDPLMSGDAKTLMKDGFTVTDIPSRMSFTGLAPGDYEVVAYGLLPTNPLSMTSFLGFDGNPTGGTWPGGFQEDFTHVRTRFTVSGSPFEVTWTSPVPMGVGFCNGLQLARVWHDLGLGLAGAGGTPLLQGVGHCEVGENTRVVLTNGAPNAATWLLLGLSELSAPFKGGVLVPSPDIILDGLSTSGTGTFQLLSPWPAGVPAGFEIYWQAWIADAGAPKGFAASNGLSCTAG